MGKVREYEIHSLLITENFYYGVLAKQFGFCIKDHL